MLGSNYECPSCGSESGYFNGSEYECPECDHIWNDSFSSEFNKLLEEDDED